jgi:RNA polymerase sigma-70 factor (ECF subfamily)
MGKQRWQKDKELAEKICDELRKGNGKAILTFYNDYHNILLNFLKKTLPADEMSSELVPDDIMNDFWCLALKRTSIICGFKGNSTLLTYLIEVLKNHVKDIKKRKDVRNALQTDNITSVFDDDTVETESLLDKKLYAAIQTDKLYGYMSQDLINTSMGKKSPEATRRVLLRRALKILSRERPEDGRLIGYRLLQGLSYDEIADRICQPEDMKERQTIKNRLKKRFERARKPLKNILCQCLAEEGMELADLFG